jgi:hypothetical protein
MPCLQYYIQHEMLNLYGPLLDKVPRIKKVDGQEEKYWEFLLMQKS